MAATIFFFMTDEDEKAFFRLLEQRNFQIYPEISDPDYEPEAVTPEMQPSLTEDAYYLHLPEAGQVFGRVIRRGKNAGMMELDEIASAVFHYERSRLDGETGELRSGRIWAELVAVGDKMRRDRKPDLLHVVFEEVRSFMKKRYIRSDPPGFFIGPDAGRKAKAGLVLREAGRKGNLYSPHR